MCYQTLKLSSWSEVEVTLWYTLNVLCTFKYSGAVSYILKKEKVRPTLHLTMFAIVTVLNTV